MLVVPDYVPQHSKPRFGIKLQEQFGSQRAETSSIWAGLVDRQITSSAQNVAKCTSVYRSSFLITKPTKAIQRAELTNQTRDI
eukprot:3633466-Amphidinium_carterae.1